MHNPFNVTIKEQGEGEEIIKIWRHHPITLVPPAARVLAFAAIPLLLLILGGLAMFTSIWLLGMFFVILAITVTYAAYEWASWFSDVYILTDRRLINVEQHGFFNRRFAEAKLDRVEDVSFEISGPVQTLFGYGDVLVQTAGAESNLTLAAVSDPQDQSGLILERQKMHLEANEEKPLTAEDLISLLAKHRDHLDELSRRDRDTQKDHVEEQLDGLKETAAKRPKKSKK